MRVTKAEVFSIIQRARVQNVGIGRPLKNVTGTASARSKQRRQSGPSKAVLVLDEPRVPDTRISQITNAQAQPVATGTRLPTAVDVFGAAIAELAPKHLSHQP